ncbi:hypothetical protein DOTSEDRAFT_58733 [Dothistroma septosporum NZE10]|uniref:Uncharacterized protein n=1 Tax=Dothistroma septosporum (strain NZE10 / CBS 128990) TaxID=675120 RepID=N1Q184_DOTSN|nr:hypothetical protein DOTSEDRAFT_58733 [Dothistroma septosporum NZE10]
MLATDLTPLLALVAVVTARPIPRSTKAICPQNLITIAPDTTSCEGAEYPEECRTAAIAAPNIAKSFEQFNLHSFGAQAAAVAIQLFESGDFRYNKNHFPAPGRPGQGTRNMQSPAFNEKYAEYLTSVSDSGIGRAQLDAARAEGPTAVLELVNTDQWSFASAAWFIDIQCSDAVKQGLDAGTQEGFSNYITECVGTTLTEDRTAGWQKVIAMGKW